MSPEKAKQEALRKQVSYWGKKIGIPNKTIRKFMRVEGEDCFKKFKGELYYSMLKNYILSKIHTV